MSTSNKISPTIFLLRRFLFLSFLAGFLCAISWCVYKAAVGPYMHIWSIDIVGNRQVSAQAIHHLSDLHYGKHYWSIDLDMAQEKIKRHPWIHSAAVRWSFPSNISIEIEEESISALLALDNLWYINDDGTPFHIAQAGDLDYPIITGIPRDWVDRHPHVVQKIISESLGILEAISQSQYLKSDNISEIYFQKNLGFSIILHNGSKIILGFYEPKSRLDRLSEMVANGLDFTKPKQIVLDAEKVAVVIPITN